jgi:hypothetical protein
LPIWNNKLDRVTNRVTPVNDNSSMKERENKMLYVIKKDLYHWVETFSTLVEAQTRFNELKAENSEWNLQILLKKQK